MILLREFQSEYVPYCLLLDRDIISSDSGSQVELTQLLALAIISSQQDSLLVIPHVALHTLLLLIFHLNMAGFTSN